MTRRCTRPSRVRKFGNQLLPFNESTDDFPHTKSYITEESDMYDSSCRILYDGQLVIYFS